MSATTTHREQLVALATKRGWRHRTPDTAPGVVEFVHAARPGTTVSVKFTHPNARYSGLIVNAAATQHGTPVWTIDSRTPGKLAFLRRVLGDA